MEKITIIKKSQSWQMFNQISSRYDLLNRLLSFGLDLHWRKLLNKFLPKKERLVILDLATGTGDVPIILCKLNPQIVQAKGVDLAENMLLIGRKKIENENLTKRINLERGDANQTSFPSNSFDAATIAFGIRNVEAPSKVLNEMHRVLNKNGKALILEFSMPANIIIRRIHVWYLRTLVPMVGGMITGNKPAYTYLNQTIEQFPYGEEFCALLKKAGFINVKPHSLLFGTATIYEGTKG